MIVYWSVAGTVSVWLRVPEDALTVRVNWPVTAWFNTSLLWLARLLPSPEYFAVMAWVPTANELMLRVAL